MASCDIPLRWYHAYDRMDQAIKAIIKDDYLYTLKKSTQLDIRQALRRAEKLRDA